MDRVQISAEDAAQITAAAKASPASTPASQPSTPAAERPAEVPEKFWKDGKVDYIGMAKAYSELEKKQSTPAPKAEPQAQTTPPPSEPIKIPGIEDAELAAFTEELKTSQKLSEASYEKLKGKGFPKAVVDAYLKGMQSEAPAQKQEQPPVQDKAATEAEIKAAVAANEVIKELKDSIGGDAGLKTMLDWAGSNLTPEELAEYNGAVSSGEPAKVKMAVNGLHALYAKESGQDPQLLGGTPPNGQESDVYASTAQMMEDMGSEKYRKDPAEQRRVALKLKRSKII